MRPGQHNKRGRGRNRRHNGGGGGGGGGGNPLNRVYESNGPDVKVRGTAQTVADKYLQLGRDAQVSGDIVMAESYYQHAEHYLRILAAAQAYQQQMQQQYRRPEDDYGDDDDMEAAAEGDDSQPEIGERPGFAGETGEQPEGFDPGEMRRDYQQANRGPDQQGERRDRHDRRDRFRPRWDRNRGEGQEPGRYGNGNPQSQQPYQRREEPEAQAPVEAEKPPVAQSAEPAPPAPAAKSADEKWDGPQPSFLKRPANGTGRGRRPRREAAPAADAAPRSEQDEAP